MLVPCGECSTLAGKQWYAGACLEPRQPMIWLQSFHIASSVAASEWNDYLIRCRCEKQQHPLRIWNVHYAADYTESCQQVEMASICIEQGVLN